MVGTAIGRIAGGPIDVQGDLLEIRAWSTMKVPRTVWSLTAAATFYGALARGELLSASDTERVLDAMGRIVPEQSWVWARGGGCASRAAGAERAAGGRL